MSNEILVTTLIVGLICLATFMGFSLRSLSYNEVGINYSKYFKSIENRTYDKGFHLLGIGHEFIEYKLNV